MKVCPICQSTYEVTVDFCFKDGAPLEAEASTVTEQGSAAPDFTALTMEDLEPPDAVSLSGLIPIATPEDELRTLSMAADVPPQLEEDELATITSGVQSIAKADEVADEVADEDPDVSDPFEQPEVAEFRDRVTKSQPVWQLGPDGDAGGTDKTEDAMETVQWTGLPSGIPSQGGSGQGFLKGLALVVVALGLGFGYSMISGDPETVVVPVDPAVSATEEASDRQEPDPEPSGSDSSGEEASVEQDAPEDEGSPADEIPSADEDGAAVDEDGAAVEEGEAGPPDSSAEEDVAPPAADPPATEDEQATGSDREARDDELADANERRRREQLEERKQRRKDAREQARADAAKEKLAARDTASNGPTPKQADKKAAGPKGGEESESAAWNPWTSGGSAAPKPAAATSDKGTDPANPWGVGAPPTSKPAESARTRVSITTKPAGAKVKVAGTSRGASPVKMELPLGTHEIQVSKEGYLPGSRYVKVTDADPISISIALEPMASAAAKREGTLFISSSPSGALLYVDGSSKGRTPISVAVTEGAHSLKLVSDGRDPVEKRIRVNFARSTTVRRFIEIP